MKASKLFTLLLLAFSVSMTLTAGIEAQTVDVESPLAMLTIKKISPDRQEFYPDLCANGPFVADYINTPVYFSLSDTTCVQFTLLSNSCTWYPCGGTCDCTILLFDNGGGRWRHDWDCGTTPPFPIPFYCTLPPGDYYLNTDVCEGVAIQIRCANPPPTDCSCP